MLLLLTVGVLWTVLRKPDGDQVKPGAEVVGERYPVAELDVARITEEVAKDFYPPLRRPGSRKVYDPIAGTLLAPDKQFAAVVWPEHSQGEVVFATNPQGFRENEPTPAEKAGYRIIVSGDSHTEGAVNNDESFANRFEQLLNNRPGHEPIEVINAGVGGTGPFEFVGILKRFMDLQPDMFIAALFTGNDPHNALRMSDYFTGRSTAARSREYTKRLSNANKRFKDQISQGFNQAYRFREMPEEAELSLQATVAFFLEMKRLCDERGIVFVTVVIPTKPDVDLEHDVETRDALFDALAMNDEEYAINDRLGKRFAWMMEQEEIPCINPTALMRKQPGPFYWAKDHHLNVRGHDLVAKLLFKQLAQSIP